jgi:hypothetical protein
MTRPALSLQQIQRFRVARHHLDGRLDSADAEALATAAWVGVQNTPPGMDTVALGQRIDGLTAEDVSRALTTDKSLVTVWSLRSAAYTVARTDLDVFTRGALPDDEDSLRACLQGFTAVLDEIGMSASHAVGVATTAVRKVLDGRVLTKRELGAALAPEVPKPLRPYCEPSEFSRFGAMLVRPVGLTGLFCFAPRSGSEASFLLTEQWLDEQPAFPEREVSRAELVRRYLSAYGPSTAADFASWVTISETDARRTWKDLEDELVTVDTPTGPAQLLAADLDAALDAPRARGLRFLPPSDPLLGLRDRKSLVTDAALQKRIWKSAHSPGVVLLDGSAVATWKQRAAGKKLAVTLEALTELSTTQRGRIDREAAADLTRFWPAGEVTTRWQ